MSLDRRSFIQKAAAALGAGVVASVNAIPALAQTPIEMANQRNQIFALIFRKIQNTIHSQVVGFSGNGLLQLKNFQYDDKDVNDAIKFWSKQPPSLTMTSTLNPQGKVTFQFQHSNNEPVMTVHALFEGKSYDLNLKLIEDPSNPSKGLSGAYTLTRALQAAKLLPER